MKKYISFLLILVFACKKKNDISSIVLTNNCQWESLTVNNSSTTTFIYNTNGTVQGQSTTYGAIKLVAQFLYNSDGKISKITLTKNTQPFIIEDFTKYENGLPVEINSTYGAGITRNHKLEWKNNFLSKITTTSASSTNINEIVFETDTEGNMLKQTLIQNGVMTNYFVFERDISAKQLTPKGLDIIYNFDEYDDYIYPNSAKRVTKSKGFSIDTNKKETLIFDNIFTNFINKNGYISSYSLKDNVSNQTTKADFTYSGCD